MKTFASKLVSIAPLKSTPFPVSPTLRGIVPPLITPLLDHDSLDVAGLERLIEHILAGGVHGLFILGTSGEAPALSYRLRREVIQRVCGQVAGRVPVLVGITDTALVEAVALAQHAAAAGAQAVVTAAPYYLPFSQDELAQFVEQLTEELPLPLFLYNYPQLTKVWFEPAILRRLAQIERIVGIKDSSGDLDYFDSLLTLKKERPDWAVLVGPEHLLLETLRRGGDGGVNGSANFHPRLLTDLFKAVEQADQNQAEALQLKLLALGEIYNLSKDATAIIRAMKCACSLLGLCENRFAEPITAYGARESGRIREIFKSLGLISKP
jgi:4-hydroxy-tetrahydrodipicolinate synthase